MGRGSRYEAFFVGCMSSGSVLLQHKAATCRLLFFLPLGVCFKQSELHIRPTVAMSNPFAIAFCKQNEIEHCKGNSSQRFQSLGCALMPRAGGV
jgi:hypothetical protein